MQTLGRARPYSSAILRILSAEAVAPTSLQPSLNGLEDHVDLWYRKSTQVREHPLKKALWKLLKAARTMTGVSMVPNLSLAIAKGTRDSSGGA